LSIRFPVRLNTNCAVFRLYIRYFYPIAWIVNTGIFGKNMPVLVYLEVKSHYSLPLIYFFIFFCFNNYNKIYFYYNQDDPFPEGQQQFDDIDS
jgi:hypothetical protein